jgi:hypothetical protein
MEYKSLEDFDFIKHSGVLIWLLAFFIDDFDCTDDSGCFIGSHNNFTKSSLEDG